jgi:hypothetical protein
LFFARSLGLHYPTHTDSSSVRLVGHDDTSGGARAVVPPLPSERYDLLEHACLTNGHFITNRSHVYLYSHEGFHANE